ncbi:MAG: anti-sigma factor, partial [Actinobacteria bacterium]|nr:anti-sigma factor [Actinomycetota bacterium]
LGGPDPQDEAALAREMGEHGPDCPECRRLVDEYAEVAGRLAFALDPAPVREGLEDETVALTRGLVREPGRRRAGWRTAVAVAAAFAIFAGGWLFRDLTESERPGPAAFIADARLVSFRGTGGQLIMAYRPGRPGAYLFGTGLQTPPQGKVYELWAIRGQTPVRSGCFSPQGEGGTLLTYVNASPDAADLMAVTVEPEACPDSPSAEPILTAEL